MNLNLLQNVEVDGVDTADYPDFVDAYISYAEDGNGNALTDDELARITDECQDFVQELAHDSIMGGA